MSTFRVGEIAIINGIAEVIRRLRETECVVMEIVEPITRKGKLGARYLLRCVDGKDYYAKQHHIRKKYPPTTGEQIIRDMFIPVARPEMEPA